MSERQEKISSKSSSLNNEEQPIKTNVCIQCKNEIPLFARLCTHCGSYQNKFKNFIKYAAIVVGFFAVLVTALMHSASLYPMVKTILFPKPEIEVIGVKSNLRLIIANKGNQELFITHVHYEGKNIPYADIAKEMISIVKDKSVGDVNLELNINVDFFDTNEDLGLIIKPGQVIKHNFEIDIPEGMTFVRDREKKEWDQIVYIAGLNKKSSCIRPVFFSPNDRRYLQLQKAYSNRLNTFPGQGSIHAFSPELDRTVEFPFKIVGTVVISKSAECTEKIERWINPRRGHIEDLK